MISSKNPKIKIVQFSSTIFPKDLCQNSTRKFLVFFIDIQLCHNFITPLSDFRGDNPGTVIQSKLFLFSVFKLNQVAAFSAIFKFVCVTDIYNIGHPLITPHNRIINNLQKHYMGRYTFINSLLPGPGFFFKNSGIFYG